MLIYGALCFGLVVGWITYRTLRRTKTNGLNDIATVIGVVGGAAVTSLFPAASVAFSAYCIGLAIGFFLYLIIAGIVDARAPRHKSMKTVSKWLGGEPGLDETQAGTEEHDLPIAGG